MSELRIALVAEGPTDYAVINAALNAIVDIPFILTLLQPEPTYQSRGTGWCGVLKWCHDIGRCHTDKLTLAPLLSPIPIDMIILHIDADIADNEKCYENCGSQWSSLATENGWSPLPYDHEPCPPSVNTSTYLRDMMRSWLHPALPDRKTVFCIPSRATDTWLLAAVMSGSPSILADIECRQDPATFLGSGLPKKLRINKSVSAYTSAAPLLIQRWKIITDCCPQALAFQNDVRAVMKYHTDVQSQHEIFG